MRASRWKQKDGVINWTADPKLLYHEPRGDLDGEVDADAEAEDEGDAVDERWKSALPRPKKSS